MFQESDVRGLPTAEARARCSRALMRWYRANARVLPWRGIHDPYRTWVSEIMLQQTRVQAVLDHYARFLERFPTMLSLALAPESDVLALWSGLGYYRRARMLHRAAKFVVQNHGGALPATDAELRRLPGIGAYTSAAIASIAFGQRVAVVDGNVERVLLRITGKPEAAGKAAETFLSELANSLVPEKHPGDHNQAMMELGAMVCTPQKPQCDACPVFDFCITRGEHVTQPRAPMKSQRVHYGLVTRKLRGSMQVEILLQRRAEDVSLMAGMLELPPVSAPQSEDQGPALLQVRHAIVGTNYYVEVFGFATQRRIAPHLLTKDRLEWVPARELASHPLTGLARKVLQRLRLMSAPVDNGPAPVPMLIGRGGRVQAD